VCVCVCVCMCVCVYVCVCSLALLDSTSICSQVLVTDAHGTYRTWPKE